MTTTETGVNAFIYLINSMINFIFGSMPIFTDGGTERPSLGWVFLYIVLIMLILRVLVGFIGSRNGGSGGRKKNE